MIKKSQTRLKAAVVFIGFLASSFMQCLLFLGLYISLVWRYKEVLF
jgi:hypothetical protein